MSTVKTNNVQIGQSLTASQNFVWYQPASPDGTVRLGNGNSGSVSDVITVGTTGNLTFANSVSLSAASTKTLTLNGGAGSNGLVLDASNNASFSGSATATALIPSGSTAPTNGMFLPTTNTLAWSTNSTERLRLDSSGNLGLGVTPSAWGSGQVALQIGADASFMATKTGADLNISSNAYYDGTNWRYIRSSVAASNYYQTLGTHVWRYAASGTAGNAISFTRAMTLDASGNLVVGAATAVGGSGGSITSSGPLTASGYLATHQTSRAVMEYNGNKCTLRAYGATAGTGYWAFNVGGGGGSADTQAMTLDASGNLFGGGMTSAAGYGNGFLLGSTVGGASAPALSIGHVSGAASGSIYVAFGYNGSGIGSITQNGTTGVLYNITSDQRLKTNVAPAGSAIQSILDFPVDQFDWIADGTHQDFGAIAQKAHEVIPEMVSVPANEDEMWGIDWSKAVPRLIKTIQEMNEEIQTLKAKVNA